MATGATVCSLRGVTSGGCPVRLLRRNPRPTFSDLEIGIMPIVTDRAEAEAALRRTAPLASRAAVLFGVLLLQGCAGSYPPVNPDVGATRADKLATGIERGTPPLRPMEKLSLFGGPGRRTYLGCLWCPYYDPDSLSNPNGRFRSESAKSVFNTSGVFGSPTSNYSPCNRHATDPPVLLTRSGISLGRLTVNTDIPDAVQVESIRTWIAGVCAGGSGQAGIR
jgi:hypothetical protein